MTGGKFKAIFRFERDSSLKAEEHPLHSRARSVRATKRRSPRSAAASKATRHIPYLAHLSPHIMKTRHGDLVQIFRLEGIAQETADEEDINAAHDRLNMFLRNIASPHVALWSHVIRSRRSITAGDGFGSSFSENLDVKYRSTLSTKNLYLNELYLTLVYRPEPSSMGRAFSRMEARSPVREAAATSNALRRMEEIGAEVVKSLARYGPERLSSYRIGGFLFSESSEFLQFLINGYRQRFPVLRANISEGLLTCRSLVGRETIEMRGPDSSRFGAILAIKEYPNPSIPGMFNGLLRGNFEFVLTQSFSCLDQAAARGLLRRQRDRLEMTEDDAYQQVAELTDALNDLQSSSFTMGEHHFSLFVQDSSPELLADDISEARAILGDTACVVVREDLGLEAAYWAQLPGNFPYRPRPAAVTSRNFAGFSAFHNYPTGKAKGNHWGEAVTLLKSTSGSPYFFNFHHRELGTTLILGQSGSGKTATQNFLAAQLDRFQPTGIYLDKDRGSELFILASGGRYFPLKRGEPTGFNPFALEPTVAWVDSVRRIVRACAKSTDQAFSASDEEELADAVSGVFALPQELRRFSQLLSFMRPQSENNLADRLARWCHSSDRKGNLAWVFDNALDRIDIHSSRLFGFDYTDFLDDPEVRGPIMIYLWSRFASLIDGRRLYLFIDEFWKALEDDFFIAELQNRYKTMRKQNWFLVCATQSPADALRSRIAHTVIEQTATFLFLPNPQAREAEYTDGFQLSRQEFRTVQNLNPHSHRFLVKQGQNSVVCELDLAGFDDELAVLSGTTANILLAERLRGELGPDPAVWLPAFHQARRSA